MSALLVIDVQNDFLPGGALAVPSGDEVIGPVNQLMQMPFELIVASQDFHPKDHASFASVQRRAVGDVINLDGLPQVLWPDHCVQGTKGAEFAKGLHTASFDHVIQKGTNCRVDSYSAFYDNGHRFSTHLSGYLAENSIKNVVIAGLALDWCVKFSALDSVQEGFSTTVVVDACRAVNLHPSDGQKALEEMEKQGVKLCTLAELRRAGSSFL